MSDNKTGDFLEATIAVTFAGGFVGAVLLGALAAGASVWGDDTLTRAFGAAAAVCGVMLCGAFVAGLLVFSAADKTKKSP